MIVFTCPEFLMSFFSPLFFIKGRKQRISRYMRKANIENENKTNRKQQLEGNRDYTGRRKLKKKRTKTQTKTIFDILR